MNANFYSRIGKRSFDAASAFIGLVVLSPLFVVVALAVKLTSRGPAFFGQVRVGQFGKPFRILKFRTMKHGGSAATSLLTAKGDSRVTRLGEFLRKRKIDELPQLMNVLIGDMSLVGPRPEVPRYVATYTERQKAVFSLKPGITGLSTKRFANEEDLLANQSDKESFYLTTILPSKLEMELRYCEDISFSLDLKLIFATLAGIWKVFPVQSPQEPEGKPLQSSE